MRKKLNKIRNDLKDLKQANPENKKTLDYYVDDEGVREILEAYEEGDPEFLAEMEELEQLILASPKPLMPEEL